MLHVLTLRKPPRGMAPVWYFDDCDQANAAHQYALAAGMFPEPVAADYLTDADEFKRAARERGA